MKWESYTENNKVMWRRERIMGHPVGYLPEIHFFGRPARQVPRVFQVAEVLPEI